MPINQPYDQNLAIDQSEQNDPGIQENGRESKRMADTHSSPGSTPATIRESIGEENAKHLAGTTTWLSQEWVSSIGSPFSHRFAPGGEDRGSGGRWLGGRGERAVQSWVPP